MSQYSSVRGLHLTNILWSPITVAAQFKVSVCGRSLAGIAGSNPAGGMHVCIFRVLCIVRLRFVHRVEHSSRGVLPSVVECTREASPTKDRQATKKKINETLQYYYKQMKENIFDRTGRPTEELKMWVLWKSMSPSYFTSSPRVNHLQIPEFPSWIWWNGYSWLTNGTPVTLL